MNLTIRDNIDHKYPKITVITASFNSENTIEKCICSVIEQTYGNVEYVIIDGGSTDNTKQIINKYKEHITFFISEPDEGIYDAFNKGVHHCTGDVVYFLNSDDSFFDNHVLEDVAQEFKDNPGLSFLCAKVLAQDHKIGFTYQMGKLMTIQDFKSGLTYPHQGFIAKRELFERYSGFDLTYRLASDFDFILKCFLDENNTHNFLDRIIAKFQLGGASNNYRGRSQTIKEVRSIVQKYFGTEVASEPSFSQMEIDYLYRNWLEKILLSNQGISTILRDKGISKIAIFGAMRAGQLVLEDCKLFGVEVAVFLDNNEAMHGNDIRGVPVHAPEWLKDFHRDIDAIVISVEGPWENQIISQIQNIVGATTVKIYSWKDLLSFS